MISNMTTLSHNISNAAKYQRLAFEAYTNAIALEAAYQQSGKPHDALLAEAWERKGDVFARRAVGYYQNLY